MTKTIDLSGKVALVTGAARGIGAAIAAALSEAGASVIVSDTNDRDGEATAVSLRAKGGKAEFRRHDVTQEPQWGAIVADAVKTFGGLDILVNNAAIYHSRFMVDFDAAEARKLFEVNVIGVMLGHKHAIRTMRPGGAAGKGGSIVNLSSVAGLLGTAGITTYSAAKGAVRIYTKSAAIECAQAGYGIRVNSLHPGVVVSAMSGQTIDDFVKLGLFPDRAAAEAGLTKLHPIGRLGVPTDIANAALYLASDLSSWVTASELVVDGGLSAI
ncbi:MAG TPA: glucose 1-dehydrogenase [Rhizomicrobium sp.]|nr:glucose 1-dehydrogenase [Rhizomicrobium sp.]